MQTLQLIQIPPSNQLNETNQAVEIRPNPQDVRRDEKPRRLPDDGRVGIIVPSFEASQYGAHTSYSHDTVAIKHSSDALTRRLQQVLKINSRTSGGEPNPTLSLDEQRSLIPMTQVNPSNPAYPWRVQHSGISSLPWFYRGILSSDLPHENNVVEVAKNWLDEHQSELFGLADTAIWRQKFFTAPPKLVIIRPDQKTQHYHITYQQFHNGLPVYHSKVSVKQVENNQRVSAVSSYRNQIDVDTTPQLKPDATRKVVEACIPHYLELGSSLGVFEISDWTTKIREHEGQQLLILPFAGKYHLAYEVLLQHIQGFETWSFFVDAHSGALLGHPQALSYFSPTCDDSNGARYFTSSAAVANDNVNPDCKRFLDNENPCIEFMDITIRKVETTGELPPNDIQTTESPPEWADTSNELPNCDALNLAIHAADFREHFLNYTDRSDNDPNRNVLQKRIHLIITQELNQRFNADFDPFHTDGEGRIAINIALEPRNEPLSTGVDKPVIHNPTRDPELLYHELTHAFMWQLNGDPFNNHSSGLPFARALIEGYANYFARSFGESQTPDKNTLIRRDEDGFPMPFAHAAYQINDWEDRWSMLRYGSKAGEDLLSIPNHYPADRLSEDLHEYDTGMILARCLWSIRQMLGPEAADGLALEISNYAIGWLQSFEVLEEALLDTSLKSTQLHGATELFRTLFAYRGVMVNQGINTLCYDPNSENWLVGSDKGVWSQNTNGWEKTQLPNETELIQKEVLKILTVGASTCVLTEKICFYRLNQNPFTTILETPSERFISVCGYKEDSLIEHFFILSTLRLHIIKMNNGSLGTHHSLDLPDSTRYWLPHDLAIDSAHEKLYVVSTRNVHALKINNMQWVNDGLTFSDPEFPVHALCPTENEALIATQKGIFSVSCEGERVKAEKRELNIDSSFLNISCHEGVVFANTPSKLILFHLNATDQTNFQEITPPFPYDVSHITSLAQSPDRLMVGTYSQGAWSYPYKAHSLDTGKEQQIIELSMAAGHKSLLLTAEGIEEELHLQSGGLEIFSFSVDGTGDIRIELDNADTMHLWDISRTCIEIPPVSNKYPVYAHNDYCLIYQRAATSTQNRIVITYN